jgi:very-short-patch-repair endonuclease/energy-coupling factor transporter ATP-binding protein EcfA2
MSNGYPLQSPAGDAIQPAPIIERQRLVLSARDGWKRQLMDLSRRNNLLYFRELRTGTLKLDGLSVQARQGLILGNDISPLEAFPETDREQVAGSLREIWRRSRSNQEEKGLETLFLAIGMASWKIADEGRPPESPILLLPISVSYKGTDPRSATLKRAGDLQLNPALVQVLKTDHGCSIDEASLLADLDVEGAQFDPAAVFSNLQRLAAAVPGFSITDRLVLGNFSFQKMAMVRDLDDFEGALVGNDLIAAIAGDKPAQAAIQRSHFDIDPRELDRIPPDDEWLILKSDSSQRAAIEAIKKGQHLVIQGPPGTGKSQSIANLIGALVADGKRVLFVAEKRAALEVVLQRLKDVGLEHLVLDLHGADISKKEIVDGLKLSSDTVRNSAEVDCADVHRRFAERRAALNGHDAELHLPRAPSGLSVYYIEGRLLKMPPAARSPLRWRARELLTQTPAAADRISDLLAQAGGFQDLLFKTGQSPWMDARFESGDEAIRTLDMISMLSSASFPKYRADTARLFSSCGLSAPNSLVESRDSLNLVKQVEDVLAQMEPQIFDQDLESMLATVRPATGGFFSELKCALSSGEFRRTRKALRSLERFGAVPTPDLYRHGRFAADVMDRWRALSTDKKAKPGIPPAFHAVAAQHASVMNDISALSGPLGRNDLVLLEFDRLGKLLDELTADRVTPLRLVNLKAMSDELARLGCGKVLEYILAKCPSPELWPELYKRAWLESCLDEVRAEVPSIPGFNGRNQDRLVRDFRALDDERLLLASSRIKRKHGQHVIDVMNRFPDQASTIKREMEKKSRHKPLRALMAESPDVLTALCPCWMASPLSVSQLLDAGKAYFDYVIFDEASQVLPETAIPAIMRGAHVIVSGDSHQLPPTIFFTAMEDEDSEEEPSSTAGFQSILDLMSAFVETRYLEWHYRSRDEKLISFSNHHIYNDRLITFPGTGKQSALSHVLVDQSVRDGQEESSAEEVRRVVELVLEHARARPDESLGVITMGIKHAKRLEAALDDAIGKGVQNEGFFDPERKEHFFIKNLERVQGDERDAIILSIGYGKAPDGRLHYRFGPLLQDGGERRLNVAITRARYRMTVVSSFSHLDMEPGKSGAIGVQLLRAYLQFSASQGKELGDRNWSDRALNPFESDVFDTLTSAGMPLVPQWGTSGYRLDMVARHPGRPARFVLAIECDGASYHSAPMARDRDRLRQEQLEALGWRFLRIWSQDWFMRRDEEVGRTLDAYRKAVEFADLQDLSSGKPGNTGNAGNAGNAGISGVGGGSPPNPWVAPGPAACELKTRGPKPSVRIAGSIDEYEPEDIRAVVRWIQSDGKLRTDDEIVEEAARELGFGRIGTKIDATIRNEVQGLRSGRV